MTVSGRRRPQIRDVMSAERCTRVTNALDDEALALFANKGFEGGPHVPQAGEANSVKVRRVLQLTKDLLHKPIEQARVLDLGCGDGVYAIEAALAGAEVVALDARSDRMDKGAAVAQRHGLERVTFVKADVRSITPEIYGRFDAVYVLGILYHLDTPDVFELLTRVSDMCTGVTIVDTLVAPVGRVGADWNGRSYDGDRYREHDDNDPAGVRRSRLLRSIDNTFAFRFTSRALVAALQAVGFTTVLECHAPFEPGKHADRITLVALKSDRVRVMTYPSVNGLSDDQLRRRFGTAV